MSKLASRILRFDQSVSADVVAHRVRIVPDGTDFDYSFPFSELPLEPGQQETDISTMAVAPSVEGIYDTFVTAVDDAGNESDPLEIADTVFDFSPPQAPTAGSIG